MVKLLALGRREKAAIDGTELREGVVPRGTAPYLTKTFTQVPSIVVSHHGNGVTVESLRRTFAKRQPLLLLGDKDSAEVLRAAGNLALFLPGLRITSEIQSWISDLSELVNGTYILVTDVGNGFWPAFRSALALRPSRDSFIAYWPSRCATTAAALESTLSTAICCGIVPEVIDGLKGVEALVLLFVDRFASKLKKNAKFVCRIARFAAPRGRVFKQSLFEKCLAPHGLADSCVVATLRQAEEKIERRRLSKAVQRALSV